MRAAPALPAPAGAAPLSGPTPPPNLEPEEGETRAPPQDPTGLPDVCLSARQL